MGIRQHSCSNAKVGKVYFGGVRHTSREAKLGMCQHHGAKLKPHPASYVFKNILRKTACNCYMLDYEVTSVQSGMLGQDDSDESDSGSRATATYYKYY